MCNGFTPEETETARKAGKYKTKPMQLGLPLHNKRDEYTLAMKTWRIWQTELSDQLGDERLINSFVTDWPLDLYMDMAEGNPWVDEDFHKI